MRRQAGIIITDVNGVEGEFESTKGTDVLVRLASGGQVRVPADRLREDEGDYRFEGDFTTLTSMSEPRTEAEETIPIVEESLRVRKEVRETGRVRITKRTEVETETVDEPLLREDVEIRRVPIDRVVDGPVAIRHEGDVTIIPVLEERLIVQKQLVLKEELHVERRASTRHESHQVDLRRERLDVQRHRPSESDPESESASNITQTKPRGDTT